MDWVEVTLRKIGKTGNDFETKRDANQRYHAQIANDSMEKQQKERARQDYHRLVQCRVPKQNLTFYQRDVDKFKFTTLANSEVDVSSVS